MLVPWVAVPPRNEATLAVVWSSIRPHGMRETARAPATMALRPSSGLMPAWAARPSSTASHCT